MPENMMRLGLSLPTALHAEMKKLSFRQSGEAQREVTLSELYAKAVTRLVARIDGGEPIVFVQNPRLSTSRITLRLPAEVVAQIDRYAPNCTKSSVVATAAQHLLQTGV